MILFENPSSTLYLDFLPSSSFPFNLKFNITSNIISIKHALPVGNAFEAPEGCSSLETNQ